jgi:hypothetical protein
VPGPEEVSLEQWERIVTSMMAFALAGAGGDEWEEWNRGRDAAR